MMMLIIIIIVIKVTIIINNGNDNNKFNLYSASSYKSQSVGANECVGINMHLLS